MDNKLGVASSFFKEPMYEKWQSAVKAGITECELGFKWELSEGGTFTKAQNLYNMLIDSGVNVSSCHLPFGHMSDISALDEATRTTALGYYRAILDWIAATKIGIAVIHASYEPIQYNERPTRLATAIDSIKTLGVYAKSRGISLAVENLPRTCLGNCADDMLLLTDNGKNASICFDANHLLIETHDVFYEKVAPYVVTTHLSDYDRTDEKHWFPGDGCIDWTTLFVSFKKHGYTGRFVFEINETSSPKLNRIFTPSELVATVNGFSNPSINDL